MFKNVFNQENNCKKTCAKNNCGKVTTLVKLLTISLFHRCFSGLLIMQIIVLLPAVVFWLEIVKIVYSKTNIPLFSLSNKWFGFLALKKLISPVYSSSNSSEEISGCPIICLITSISVYSHSFKNACG